MDAIRRLSAPTTDSPFEQLFRLVREHHLQRPARAWQPPLQCMDTLSCGWPVTEGACHAHWAAQLLVLFVVDEFCSVGTQGADM